ncbi:unnamed protein product [Closterium sp. NIES-54]
MVHQVLQRFGFRFSSPQPTPLPIDHSLSAPLWDESIEPSGPYPELVGSLIPAGRALPCPAHHAALLAECCPALPVAPPCQLRAALPCLSRCPAGSAPPSPACHVALLTAATLGLLLLLVGSAAEARAREARVVEVAAGVVVVKAVEVVEVAEVAVRVVAGVGASVATVVAAVGVVVEVVLECGAVLRGGSGDGQRQQRRSETPMPQQLREWFSLRGTSGGSVRCPYVIRTGDRASQTCGKFHTQHRCFSHLDDTWRVEFGDEAERPRWLELLSSGVDIFALDYDAYLAAMYALTVSREGDCYLCVPPDPCIEAAALGASEPALPCTAPAEALHTFMLDSGASGCFFRDSTTLTPLHAPVPVRLAD